MYVPPKLQPGKTYVMRAGGDESVAYAYFETVAGPRGPRVHVTALIGATQYIDREMDPHEARAEWAKLVAVGFHRIDLDEALRKMPPRTLRFHIYD